MTTPSDPDLLGGYLDRLAAGLIGGRRARAEIVAEIADGLAESVEAHVRRGVPPVAAARLAVAEFGDPAELAALFMAERAGAAAHRVGLGLVVTGPAVGAVWVAQFASRSGSGWWEQAGAMLPALPAYALILAVAVPAALLAAAAGAGRLSRRLGLAPRHAATAAVIAACATVIGDGTLLVGLVAAPGWSPLATVAAGVSLARLGLAGGAARWCAALRAAGR